MEGKSFLAMLFNSEISDSQCVHSCEDYESLNTLWDNTISDSQCVQALDLTVPKKFVPTDADWDCFYSNAS